MSSIPWLIIAVAVLVVILAIVVIFAKRCKGHTPDYRTFFIIGIIWLPLGLFPDNSVFFILGLVFIAIGLVNKDKWKEPKKWSELSEGEKRLKKVLVFALVALVVVGIITVLISK